MLKCLFQSYCRCREGIENLSQMHVAVDVVRRPEALTAVEVTFPVQSPHRNTESWFSRICDASSISLFLFGASVSRAGFEVSFWGVSLWSRAADKIPGWAVNYGRHKHRRRCRWKHTEVSRACYRLTHSPNTARAGEEKTHPLSSTDDHIISLCFCLFGRWRQLLKDILLSR